MRYFLDISYRGTEFHGWQSQQNAVSVQQTIEEALSKLVGKETPIVGSGRTDTGVHAHQQIAHFDITEAQNEKDLVYKLNAILPFSIAIKNCHPVKDDAHARFDALSRRYHYYIHHQKNPFKTGLSYYFKRELDVDKINLACELIKKRTDFESFSKVHTDVKTFICSITKAAWKPIEGGFLFDIEANRFLRGMVRAIVGTLIEVGLGKLSLAEFDLIGEQKDRSAAGASVPAEGLYLQEVNYPSHIYLKD